VALAIDVQAITKQFGDFTAVDGISFSVDRGETLGLLGPNGAGKSTLIRMMTTLMLPTSGTAVVNGSDIVKDPDAVRHGIGVIPQAMTSDMELSCRENLLIFAKLYGVPKERREKLILELLEAVDLTKWADAQVKKLSGGMRRRLEIARGLVHEPKIFFLDEPTTGLDPVSRKSVWTMLERIKAERELTVLITTHMMDEADHLCDRIAIVDHGRLMALDSPIRLKAAVPGDNVLEVLFSGTPANWKGRVSALPAVAGVSSDGDAYHISSKDGPTTTMALLDAAANAGVKVQTLAVQSTTLDDVFVYFTGRQLHGDQSGAVPDPAEPAAPASR
jgi:ABC-2 type transport system ATP-binding protein